MSDSYFGRQQYVIYCSQLRATPQLTAIYSCFEKGCLTNGEKLTRQCRKLLWVMVVFTVARGNLKVFQRGGMKQHKHVFVFSRSLLLNRFEPQSSKVKLLLPIMPIGIVAYAFTLFVGQLLSKQLYHILLSALVAI